MESVEEFGRSGFLFVMPSYLSGAGRIFNVGGTPFDNYSVSASANEADRRAAFQDWASVGDDLLAAARKLSKQ